MQPTEWIWRNGELVRWADATVHVMSHALHYGSSVFEGVRVYATPDGPRFFRLREHVDRLYDSAKIHAMEPAVEREAVFEACREVVARNALSSAYVRPLVWRGYGALGLDATASPVETMVAAVEWGRYLGAEGIEKGIDVGVSSWQRCAPNTMPLLAKAGGNYLQNQLVLMEAKRHGYTEGISLSVDGTVSEGSGENLFVVRGGRILTPPASASILVGITRDAVMTLARELGHEVVECSIPRELLYIADEVFFTGTAAEITPVRSVDGKPVGDGTRGPVTAAIQQRFFGLFDGSTADDHGWLTPVKDA